MSLAAAAIALVAALSGDDAAAAATVDLGGQWALDQAASEEARPAERHPLEGLPGDAQNTQAAAIPQVGPPPVPWQRVRGRDDLEPLLTDVFDPRPQLAITQRPAEVTIDDGERVLRLMPNGRWTKRENGLVETRAMWRNGVLVAESRVKGGRKLTVRYALEAAGHLVVSADLETPSGPPMTARRVYGRASEAAAAP